MHFSSRSCEHCANDYQPQSDHQKYCSDRCYSAAYRKRRRIRNIVQSPARRLRDREAEASRHTTIVMPRAEPRPAAPSLDLSGLPPPPSMDDALAALGYGTKRAAESAAGPLVEEDDDADD